MTHLLFSDRGGGDVLMLLPRDGDSGACRMARTVAAGLAGEGLDVAVATLGAASERLAATGLPVFALPAPSRGRGPLAWAGALPALTRIVRETRPAVLLSAGNHANLFAAVAHRLAGVRATALALKLTNPIVRPGQDALTAAVRIAAHRWMMQRAEGVLVLSREDRASAGACVPESAAKLKVVANPYLDRAPGVRASRPPGEGPPLIVAVGRLAPQKRFDRLLEALSLLRDRPWRLAILGEGACAGSLQAQALSLGIAERVAFVGHADPRSYYQRAHMLVIASAWEGLPAVAVEALAVGCPVVTTDCSPALSRLVRGSGVGAVTEQGPRAVAAGIAGVLNGPWCAAPATEVFGYSLERGLDTHRAAIAAIAAAHGRRVTPAPGVLAAAE